MSKELTNLDSNSSELITINNLVSLKRLRLWSLSRLLRMQIVLASALFSNTILFKRSHNKLYNSLTKSLKKNSISRYSSNLSTMWQSSRSLLSPKYPDNHATTTTTESTFYWYNSFELALIQNKTDKMLNKSKTKCIKPSQLLPNNIHQEKDCLNNKVVLLRSSKDYK